MNPKSIYSEEELVASLRQRDEKAFGYLYDNYSGALFGTICSIVPGKEIASDVLQNVFVNIWKKIDSYDTTKGRLFTWMINIARNAAIDEVRSKAYRDSLKNVSTDGKDVQEVETYAVTNDVGLKRMLTKLKEEWRILVDLSYFQGFTHEEIAEMLNIPLGTIKTRIRSALIHLRKMIELSEH